jgi:hypothetical protein
VLPGGHGPPGPAVHVPFLGDLLVTG